MNRDLLFALVCMAGIIVITFISASSIGFSASEHLVESVKRADVFRTVIEEAGYDLPGPVVYTVTYTNSFLPRLKQLPRVTACLYDSKSKSGAYANARWRVVPDKDVGAVQQDDTLDVGIGQRSVDVQLMQQVRYLPPGVPSDPIPAKVQGYYDRFDAVLLFLDERRGGFNDQYIDCGNLQAGDVARAKRIAVVE